MWLRYAYDLKAAAFVRSTLGTIETTDEMEWAVIHEVDSDLRRPVVLAVWRTSVWRVSMRYFQRHRHGRDAPAISLLTRRSLASIAF